MPWFFGSRQKLRDEDPWAHIGEPSFIDELDRLWQAPEQWGQLSPQRLEVLTWWACVRYGASNDERSIAPLNELYTSFMRHVAPEQRKALLARVVDVVERGTASPNALMPFVYADDDLGVISSGALAIAQLEPGKAGDPLPGPRLLRQMADGTDREAVRVAILQGLLLLGDRRVLPLLRGCWRNLSPWGREELTRANSGTVSASHIAFLLDWLEDADESTFGAICAALRRMPEYAIQHVVVDVERAFPASAAGNEPPIKVLGRWTIEEYGQTLKPRFQDLLRRESEPRVLPDVMRAWGIKVVEEHVEADVERLGIEVASNAGPAGLLPEPIPCGAWLRSAAQTPLVQWGIFNPLGPTSSGMSLVPVPDTGSALIYSWMDNPFASSVWVYGLVDRPFDDPSLLSLLLALFAANGLAGKPLFTGAPTHVIELEDSPLASSEVQLLMWSAMLTKHKDFPQDFERICAAMEQEPDPWKRTLEEARVAASELDGGAAPPPAPDGALLDRWWRLVTDPKHVGAEVSQMRAAWHGALDFAARNSSPAAAPEQASTTSMRVEQLRARVTEADASRLPPQLGFGVLDPESIREQSGVLQAAYSWNGSLVYELAWGAHCELTSLFKGTVIRTTVGKDLQEALQLSLLNVDTSADPRFQELVRTVTGLGNVYVQLAGSPGNGRRHVYFPAGFLFLLRQPIAPINADAWQRVKATLADGRHGEFLTVTTDGPGTIFTCSTDGALDAQEIQLVELTTTLHSLVPAVAFCVEQGLVPAYPASPKMHRLAVFDVSLATDFAVEYGDQSAGQRAFAVYGGLCARNLTREQAERAFAELAAQMPRR